MLHDCKCLASISEPLFDNDREIIGSAFGKDKLFDIYGCAEVGNFAVDSPLHPGKHIIWNDTHVVNLLDGKSVDGKQYSYVGELMITSLIHRGFPVVNYVVGDTVEIKIAVSI